MRFTDFYSANSVCSASRAALLTGCYPPRVSITGVLFGLLHRITWMYAFFAALVGCYLGWLYVATGNLWVPMIAHGLYDFFAVVYLRQQHVRGALADGND